MVFEISDRIDEGSAVSIIPSRSGDADFIQTLSRQVFVQYGPYDKTLPRWYLADMAITFLAIMENEPVGFAMLGRAFYDIPLSRSHELLAIAIAPEVQGQGIGGLLLNKIISNARKQQADTLLLHTARENLPAQKLFTQHGFAVAETKTGFYPEGQDAVMMVRHLTSPP